MKLTLTFSIFSLICGFAGFAQTQQLSLADVVLMARDQSIAAKQAATQQRTNFWQYRSFQSDFRPQLSLDAAVPRFNRDYIEVPQPDGSIDFKPVSNNNSIISLSLSQNIPLTGGSVFLEKQLQRFDDFSRNVTLYNGNPFAIRISQPLFRFNKMKWDRKIEPLRYEEGNQEYIESMEQAALDATGFFFDLLVTQVNLQIAEKNRSNNDTLYKIALQKSKLGRISRNDLLQLQLTVLTARKDLATARQQAAVASLKLKAFIGYRDDRSLELLVPAEISPVPVNLPKALQEAFNNRPAAIAFRRRMLEADRDVDRAKKENGLNASLDAAFGLSNRGTHVSDVYQRPQDREFVELQLSIPLITWGRAQARTETAKANQQLTVQSVEQDKLTFEQEIYTQVSLLEMLQEQVSLTAEADRIAQERYAIAQDRFILSDLSVTDLGIALQEKDQARRDAIIALRDYWQAYYTLRLLTLYDFERNDKIRY